MKMLVLKYLAAAGFTAFAFVACGGGSSTSGGGTDVPENEFDVASIASECGGLGMGGGAGPIVPHPDQTTYCDAEHLLWQYNEAAKTIGMTNSRIVLNCCGVHSVKVTRDGETIVFTEIDAPKGDARCKCECVYDYAADVAPIEKGMLSLRIVRNVTDADPPTKIAWEGKIDLSPGAGEVVVNTDSADPWCTPPMP